MVTRPEEAANANASESVLCHQHIHSSCSRAVRQMLRTAPPGHHERRLVLIRTGRRGDDEMNLILGVQRLHRRLFLLHGDPDDCLALPHDSGTGHRLVGDQEPGTNVVAARLPISADRSAHGTGRRLTSGMTSTTARSWAVITSPHST